MSDCISIQRGYKYRAYPSEVQQQWLGREFGAVRFVYNHFLTVRRNHYKATGTGLSYSATAALLTQLKQDAQYAWLKLSNAQTLQQALVNLDNAFVNFFEKRGGYPQFKSKRGRQSFRVPQWFRVEGDTVILPKLKTPLRFKQHRRLRGMVKSVTISQETSGKYYVSFLVEEIIQRPQPVENEMGIDLGLHSFLVTSQGEKVAHPKLLNQSRKKLRRLKRRHSRTKKGSVNREKARLKLARQEERVAHQRRDFLHRLSYHLMDENQAVSVETLAVKHMVKNHKLARSIADSGWSEFIRQLEYKAQWKGRELYKIDRWLPSTQLCSDCGYQNTALTLKDREWMCPACGTKHDRDMNAAKNILNAGKRTAGRAGTADGGNTVGNAFGEHVRPAKRRRFSSKKETYPLVG